jgi:hypothetical protein
MAKKNKKAYLVDVNLYLRVLVDEDIDPDMDPEFDKAVIAKIKHRMLEEGDSFFIENIDKVEDDIECPYDPEFD